MRRIDVSVDTFALIWAARESDERDEDAIIARLAAGALSGRENAASRDTSKGQTQRSPASDALDRPKTPEWVDVLVWTLKKLGGRGSLAEIYSISKEGRKVVGLPITKRHDDAARERLESYCSESKNYKMIADLFCMPDGKGAGIWALNEPLPERYR